MKNTSMAASSTGSKARIMVSPSGGGCSAKLAMAVGAGKALHLQRKQEQEEDGEIGGQGDAIVAADGVWHAASVGDEDDEHDQKADATLDA
eukprot:4828778-Prymnesium_polylepis.1